MITKAIATIFGQTAFTPVDMKYLFGGQWPTLRQLREKNKQGKPHKLNVIDR